MMNDLEKYLPEILRSKLGEEIVSSSRVPTGKHNTSFFIETKAEDYVIRIAPPDDTVLLFYERNMMAQEPEVHRLVRERTSIPVAEILDFDQSRSIIDRDYIIMRRLPGNPLSQNSIGPESYDAIMYKIGEYLAELHEITTDRYGYIGAHGPMESKRNWWEAFRIMWGKLVDDIVGVGMYDEDEKNTLIEILDANSNCFERPVKSSLLHMDIWAQNILIDEQHEITGIVDWDRALWGDPEIEYAVLDYCGISRDEFWRGYGRARENTNESKIRYVFYYLYEHQKYILIRLARRNNPEAAGQYKSETFRILRENF